ncbi:hypothetical protein [Nonomuraea sp. SBT364]|uniref:hypothetical protein n=1 Tax=Nonomuraea sp. SBT364 TaxID=1580530 RepID=UPI00066A827B|nr:hypothetical protein [Nonomuraea sp. SBT364]
MEVQGRIRHEPLAEAVRARGPYKGEALHRLALSSATALARLHVGGVSGLRLAPGTVVLGPRGQALIDWRTPSEDEDLRADDVRDWAGVVVFAATGRESDTDDLLPPALRSVVEECRRPDAEARPSAVRLVRVLLGHSGAAPVSSVDDLLREAELRVLGPGREVAGDVAVAAPFWRRPAFYAGVAAGAFLVVLAAVSLVSGDERPAPPLADLGRRTAAFEQRAEQPQAGDSLVAAGTLTFDPASPTTYEMRLTCGPAGATRSGRVRLGADGGSVDGVAFDLGRPGGACVQQYALHARRNSSPRTIQALLAAAGTAAKVTDGPGGVRDVSGSVPLESVRGEETVGAYAGVIVSGAVGFELRVDGDGLPVRLRLRMTGRAGPLVSETVYRDWRTA